MFQINRSFPLFDKAGTEVGSGGGGTDGGKSAEVKLTDEMRAEIGALISGALKSEGKRQIAGAVKEALEGLKLGESIAAEVAKLKPAEPDPKDDKSAAKPDPKIAALEARLQEVTAKLTAESEERGKAVEAAKNEKAFIALKTALGPHVRPEVLELAARDLFVAQKRVTVDEQGNPLLTVRKAPYPGQSEEDIPLPLADGVKHWLGTTEGKFFVPAHGVGTGQQQQGGKGPFRAPALGVDGMPHYDQPATTDAERIRRADEQAKVLAAKYPHLAGQ